MEHRVTRQLRDWLQRSLRTVARRCCSACGETPSDHSLCARCREESAISNRFHHQRVPLRDGTLLVHGLGLYWNPSGTEPSPAARLLHRFKYTRERAAGRTLARLLAERATPVLGVAQIVLVPIPLHVRRLRSRGFNQAAWLARAVSKRYSVSVHADALIRPHDDAPRPGRTARERRTSTAPAFVPGRRPPADRPVVLVDDVCTTGMTLAAAASVLATHGHAIDGAIVLLLADRARHDDTTAPSEEDR